MEPPLPTVVEEGEEGVRPYERIRNESGCPPLAVESREPTDAVSEAPSDKEVVGGLATGGRRAALDRFRHGCLVLGAKAARAGGGAISVAAAVASEAAKEAVQTAKAAVRAGGEREAADDQRLRGETDERDFEEYWGSDYCTSA